MLTVGGEPRDVSTTPTPPSRAELERYKPAPLPDLPPFAGGAVGLFGYDLVRYAEPTVGDPNPDELGVPDLALMVSDVLVAFDHFKHETTILANVFTGGDADVDAAYAAAVDAIADVRERLAGPLPRARARRARDARRSRSNMGDDGYADGGRARQGVHPRGRRLPGRAEPALVGRRAGRGVLDLPRPAQRQPVARTCTSSTSRTSRSPARRPSRSSRSRGRRAEQRPIAGTRPRAATVEEDMRVAESLLADEKERAEHVMLVDLGRNDLGRVCEYGSVHGRRADGRRDLLARHAHRLVGLRHAARRA